MSVQHGNLLYDIKRHLSDVTSKFNNNVNVSSKTIWRSWNVLVTEDVYVKKNTDPSGKIVWNECVGVQVTERVTNPGCKTVSPGTSKKISVTILVCIMYHGVGTLFRVNSNINSKKYIDILDNNLFPLVARHFPDNYYLFMENNAPAHWSHFQFTKLTTSQCWWGPHSSLI